MFPASEEVWRVPVERILYAEVRLLESECPTAGQGRRECRVLVSSWRSATKTLHLTNILVERIYVHTYEIQIINNRRQHKGLR